MGISVFSNICILSFLRGVLMICVIGISANSGAAAPVVGRKAAEKYFTPSTSSERSSFYESSNGDTVLMLHLGGFTDSQAYRWASRDLVESPGQSTYGLTYLFDEWHGLDANLRVDFTEYALMGNRAAKISFLPLFILPRAETRFPLYFGLGAGGGMFLQQLNNKSNISFDYQLVMGLRFMNLARNFGMFFEFGMKNQLLLLSEGQFNGTALAAGAIFNF